MRYLLFILLFIPLIGFSQYNQFHGAPTEFPEVKTMWEVQPLTQPISYWEHRESRQQFTVGLAVAGIAGLSFYFDTLADGPYKPLGYFYSGVAVGKFIHAGILRKREKNYDQWGRPLH